MINNVFYLLFAIVVANVSIVCEQRVLTFLTIPVYVHECILQKYGAPTNLCKIGGAFRYVWSAIIEISRSQDRRKLSSTALRETQCDM